MNFINKIKFNYNTKLLDDLYLNGKTSEILSLLKEKKNKDKNTYIELVLHFIKKFKNHQTQEDFFNNKVVLINSFDMQDCSYLSNFFKFYFDKMYPKCVHSSISNAIATDLAQLNSSFFPKKIEFEHFIKVSEFFLISLLINDQNNNFFLKSNSAFFEASKNNFFIYPYMTAAYFFIHKNPLKIYASFKKKYQSSQEALNQLFNFQNELISNQETNNEYQVLENRQSWNIHSTSWNDPNVLSTYRGLVISESDFFKSPQETLVKVLFHLIQAGMKFEMNYDLIEQYIENNPINEMNFHYHLSNKERKILLSNLDSKLLDQFDYQI